MKKVISLGCLGIVLAAASFGTVQAAQQKPVRLASDFTYPPFNYKDASGTPQGFDIEIADALCAEAQLNCEWVTQSWDGLIPSLLARKSDVIMASMRITEERKKRVLDDRFSGGTLVASDGSALAMVVIPGETGNSIERLALEEQILTAVDQARLSGYLSAVAGLIAVDVAHGFGLSSCQRLVYRPHGLEFGIATRQGSGDHYRLAAQKKPRRPNEGGGAYRSKF